MQDSPVASIKRIQFHSLRHLSREIFFENSLPSISNDQDIIMYLSAFFCVWGDVPIKFQKR